MTCVEVRVHHEADMLLGIRNPGAEFLTAKDLHSELEEVRTALQTEYVPDLAAEETLQNGRPEMAM